MWKKHCNVSEENIYYIMNKIQKLFNMGILDYAERVRDMFEIKNLPPTPIRNNEKYDDAIRETRDMYYKEDITPKAVKEVLN